VIGCRGKETAYFIWYPAPRSEALSRAQERALPFQSARCALSPSLFFWATEERAAQLPARPVSRDLRAGRVQRVTRVETRFLLFCPVLFDFPCRSHTTRPPSSSAFSKLPFGMRCVVVPLLSLGAGSLPRCKPSAPAVSVTTAVWARFSDVLPPSPFAGLPSIRTAWADASSTHSSVPACPTPSLAPPWLPAASAAEVSTTTLVPSLPKGALARAVVAVAVMVVMALVGGVVVATTVGASAADLAWS